MDQKRVVEKIEEKAIPMKVSPEAEFEEAEALKEIFEGKKVIGMGEATHGTREFFRMKHRLFRFLVKELDFRIFGMEANFSECTVVNDYIVNGEGSAKEALAEIEYWTWRTEEVRAMIEWMREYNESRDEEEKVKFYGLDARDTSKPASAVRKHLEDVDPEYLDEVSEGLQKLENGVPEEVNDIREWLETAEETIEAIEKRFEEYRNDYMNNVESTQTSKDGFELAERHLKTLKKGCELRRKRVNDEEEEAFKLRDEFMTESVSWILDYENEEKIALWGHNGHIRKDVVGTDDEYIMGQFLDEKFGDDYYALGFDFGYGSFRAIPESEDSGPQEISIDEVEEGTASEVFSELNNSTFFLDMNSVSKPEIREWLESVQQIHALGAVFYEHPDAWYHDHVLGKDYDGLVFVEETEEAVPVDSN